ncbi:MAG TPA: alcohol dehydrogenase catalytic domain-containing protein [Acidimicrobiales bacterium]|nr:alcohol dehydrogenase catalytic domain-containing protein [Acidimicrobiales bacterium]
MRAAVYHGRRDVRVEELPDPVPSPGELVLEIHAAGVCGSDAKEFAEGPFAIPLHGKHPVTGHGGPTVLGHEIAGRVVAIGRGVEGFELGEVVACGGGMSCGTCRPCRAGRTNLCTSYATLGHHRHGGLAQFCAVPSSICLSVRPFGLEEDAAALAQPMAIAVHAASQARLTGGSSALVIGVGGIGAPLVYVLASQGIEVTVVDLRTDRLALARELGAASTVVPAEGTRIAEVLAGDGIRRPEAVFEVSGSEAGLLDALDSVDPGGQVVAVGLHAVPRAIDVRRLTLRELQLHGTNAHAFATDLPRALSLLAARHSGWGDLAPCALTLEEVVPSALVPLAEGASRQVKYLVDPFAALARPASCGVYPASAP